jgi:hypothetical protein
MILTISSQTRPGCQHRYFASVAFRARLVPVGIIGILISPTGTNSARDTTLCGGDPLQNVSTAEDHHSGTDREGAAVIHR